MSHPQTCKYPCSNNPFPPSSTFTYFSFHSSRALATPYTLHSRTYLCAKLPALTLLRSRKVCFTSKIFLPPLKNSSRRSPKFSLSATRIRIYGVGHYRAHFTTLISPPSVICRMTFGEWLEPADKSPPPLVELSRLGHRARGFMSLRRM